MDVWIRLEAFAAVFQSVISAFDPKRTFGELSSDPASLPACYFSAINDGEEACEVLLIAFVGVPVVGVCHSALGETRSIKERPSTRPSRLCAGGSAASALWNNRPTAV
jgi:hypothetical protein